jgi:mannosyl-3-phosphoglycerate phosphatase
MLQLNKTDCRPIIFSDLDGSILDEKYSFAAIRPLIARLVALKVPIILCSSKARKEIEYYRAKMGLDTPFVVENGAAIFIPKKYFKHSIGCAKQTEQYDIIEFGAEYLLIRKSFEAIKRETSCSLTGFGDMTVEKIAQDTKLPIKLAELAKQREYSEPFLYNGKNVSKLYGEARKKGLTITRGGRYFHLMGNHNKGKAVLYLKALYTAELEQIRTIGVGNERNDIEMLEAVDEPFFISHTKEITSVWEKIAFTLSDLLL